MFVYFIFMNDNIEFKSIYLVLQSGINCISIGIKVNILFFVFSCVCNGYCVVIFEEVFFFVILQYYGFFFVFCSFNEVINCVGSSVRNSIVFEQVVSVYIVIGDCVVSQQLRK